MKFKCCEHVISSFMITHNELAYCPMEEKVAFIQNYNGNPNIIDEYKTKRDKHIENCKKGYLNNKCKICSQNKLQEWDTNSKIKFIGIANRSKCSCNCIYCTEADGNTNKRIEINKRKNWNIKPLLENLENNKMLADSGTMLIAGGECSEYPKEELLWLINYASRNNFTIEFASSGMFYSKEIEYALKNQKAKIRISVDSGTKNTYEKIKRVRYYDIVWGNIKKYIKASNNNQDGIVSLKYIILNNINDNITELKAFLDKCNDVNCQYIEIAGNYYYIFSEKGFHKNIPNNFKTIINYINNLKDKRIHFDMFDIMDNIKSSARIYSSEIEESINKGNIILTIPLFAAKAETYKKLTNTDLLAQIWDNIERYSNVIKTKPENSCNIVIQYKFLLGINDSIDELNELIEKCNQLEISCIEFNISDSHINNDFTKDKVDRLKNSITHLKTIKNMNITFDSKLTDIINNI